MPAIVRPLFSHPVVAGGALNEIADRFHDRFDVFARYRLDIGRSNGGRDPETMTRHDVREFECDIRIVTEGNEVRIRDETAVMIAGGTHELVTNSIKYGALSCADDRARIAVDWQVECNRVMIRGCVEHARRHRRPLRRGFGSELIESALPNRLGVFSRVDLRPGGGVGTIDMPIGGTVPVRGAAI